jgi:hypothetical protein
MFCPPRNARVGSSEQAILRAPRKARRSAGPSCFHEPAVLQPASRLELASWRAPPPPSEPTVSPAARLASTSLSWRRRAPCAQLRRPSGRGRSCCCSRMCRRPGGSTSRTAGRIRPRASTARTTSYGRACGGPTRRARSPRPSTSSSGLFRTTMCSSASPRGPRPRHARRVATPVRSTACRQAWRV